jgi:fatty acid desaturase
MNLKDILSKEEFSEITRKDNWRGACIILFDWLVIAGLFFLAAAFPNPLVIILVIILLGSRQLGLGVIVHETGHRSLFKSRAVNDFCGKWLSGYWVFSDKEAYMKGHLKHHQEAGTERDPDLSNYLAYPVPRTSFRRKITRDVTGQVGWRRIKSIGRSIQRLGDLKPQVRQTVIRSILLNASMLVVVTALGYAWLYLLWVIAFMTSHMLVTRIRQIAEHAAVPDKFSLDARLNTRTMYISPLERLLIAPHQVSYHLEHHLMASVPIYRLKRLHELLLQKGYYEGVEFPRGYFNLLRQVTVAA